MKIILSKDDVEEVIRKVFNLEKLNWDADGNLVIEAKPEDLKNKQW